MLFKDAVSDESNEICD